MDHINYKYFLPLSRLLFSFYVDDSFPVQNFLHFFKSHCLSLLLFTLLEDKDLKTNKQTNMNYVKESFPVRVLSGLAFGSLIDLEIYFFYMVLDNVLIFFCYI